MKRLTISGIFLILLCCPAFGANAVEEYFTDHFNEIHPQETADWEIEIRVSGANRLTKIKVHSPLLKNMAPILALPFSDEASGTTPYLFQREEESSAFKKIIDFIYNNGLKKMESQHTHPNHFFEPSSIADLILLTHKFQIKGLGPGVEKFLREQINKKLSTDGDVEIWLDRLSYVQLLYLYQKISLGIQAQQPWINTIKNSLSYYNCYIFLNEDPRLEGVQMTFDPNVHLTISAILLKKHKKLEEARRLTAQDLERERQENERKQEEEESEANVQEKASRIIEQFGEDLFHKSSYEEPLRKYRYWTPQKFASRVVSILKTRLLDCQVDILDEIEGLSEQSGLHPNCHKCDREHSCGYCCAQSIGWACCLLLYPAQLLTWNYCCCCGIGNGNGAKVCEQSCECSCSDCCQCSTQMGVAVSGCVYEVGSCNGRWIIITPKASDNKLPHFPAPPAQSPLWE